MNSASDHPPAILLIPSGDTAKTALQGTADTLDEFGLGWAWIEPGVVENSSGACAAVVASPDAELPARWSRVTGLLTVRVPVEGEDRSGLALLDDGSGQLPGGMAGGVFATMAIGAAGAKNAALFVVAALAVKDKALRERWEAFRARQTAEVLAGPAPRLED